VGVTKAIWDSLTQYEREGWDRLTDKHKTLIIQLGMSLANNAPIGSRSANATDVTDEDDAFEDALDFVPEETSMAAFNVAAASPGSLSNLLGRLDTTN
jgi:hypothetical protein